jgi:hypothetical protein
MKLLKKFKNFPVTLFRNTTTAMLTLNPENAYRKPSVAN